ncbi:MAG: HEAT repeat domain-containing protein [Pseudomonadota bacterium]
MGFGASSEAVLQVAFGVGVGALGLTLALVLQVGLMRVLQRRRERARAAVQARWQPLLLRRAIGDDVALPGLAPAEQLPLLLLWNHVADSLRGPSHDRLGEVVTALGLQQRARRWLARGAGQRQLLGLLTLGHLRRAGDWEQVLPWLADPRPYLSLAAVRALLQIDAERAAAPVLDALVRRPDWPLARLALLLRDAGSAHVFEPLLARLADAPPVLAVRLVRLIAAVDAVRGSPALERQLATSDDNDVLSVCLQHVQTPGALQRVRELARHPVWWVRLQAAGALGRLGTRDDLPQLRALLSDPQWWVRYRAAGALAAMPGFTPQALAALRDTLDDRYARDVLTQVLGEGALA